MPDKKRILAIVGPTASGKSALALELAKRYDGEIVSCDSMQIYKEMNIGTAKPTREDMLEVRHHLIDIVDPDANFSCEDYAKYAAEAIDDICARGKLPIVCGGTGLYLDTLLRGGSSAPAIDTSEIRAKLCARVEAEGIMPLYEELKAVDPKSAECIHPNNEKRVIRALEIYLATGKTKSELDKLSASTESVYDASVIYLTYKNRQILYNRIDARVDQMISEGLLDETVKLMEMGVFEVNKTASQAIGYKELFSYLRGEESLDVARETLKRATRRYAKRQITWFSAKSYATPLFMDDGESQKSFEEIVNIAKNIFLL